MSKRKARWTRPGIDGAIARDRSYPASSLDFLSRSILLIGTTLCTLEYAASLSPEQAIALTARIAHGSRFPLQAAVHALAERNARVRVSDRA